MRTIIELDRSDLNRLTKGGLELPGGSFLRLSANGATPAGSSADSEPGQEHPCGLCGKAFSTRQKRAAHEASHGRKKRAGRQKHASAKTTPAVMKHVRRTFTRRSRATTMRNASMAKS